MTNPTTNFGWVMPTPTDLVTDLPADFEVFGQGVDTTMADLKGGTTGQMLTKATNTDMDFTWVTPQVGDITAVNVTAPITGGGTSGAVTIGVSAASTSASGVVQLSDSTSTTSSVLASTPTATKSAYDLANAAIPKSLLDAKGDLVSATADNTPSVVTVGANGTALIADSSATSGLRWTATPSASNPTINSAMNVWQRATSFTIASTTLTYTADRWQAYRGATGMTVTRQVTNDTTNLPSVQYCTRVARDSGNTSVAQMYLAQSFESVNSIPYAGKTVTLSFYARAGANYSPVSNGFQATLQTGTGTDQNWLSFTGAAYPLSSFVTLTTTWQRFTITGTLAATATQIALLFSMTPVGTAGANDYFELTGVQIDVGSVALPYRTMATTYQQELAACQRYFYRMANGTNAPLAVANFTSASTAWGTVYFPTTMRTAPVLTAATGTNYYLSYFGSVVNFNTLTNGNGYITTTTGQVGVSTLSGNTAGYATSLITSNASATVDWNSEL